MAKFKKKPVEIEAITFQDLVKHGIESGANVVNGMPWSFSYKGHPITHENDECYLIPTLEGTMKFGPDDMLITGVKGEIYPCKMDIFKATYSEVVDAQPQTTPCSGFHCRDGLFFQRVVGGPNHGGVVIEKRQGARDDSPTVMRMELNKSEWASVAASMTAIGETAETYGMFVALQG